jgi:small GTP-binding protein
LQEKLDKFNLFFNIILVGDFGVGKTSLINNSFKEFNLVNGIKEIYIKIKEQIIKVQIFDTCEQEKKNNSLNSSFYKYSSLAILVYSIDNKRSFENLNNWLNEIKSNNNKDIKIFLIGNKIDLINREVSIEMGENFKIDNNLDLFSETSAIENNNNKEDIFIEAIKQLYNENKNNNEHLNPNEIIIEPSNNNKNDDGSGEKKKNETDDRCFCDCCYKCILF